MHAVPFAPKPVGTTGLRPLFRQQGWSSVLHAGRSGRGTLEVAVGNSPHRWQDISPSAPTRGRRPRPPLFCGVSRGCLAQLPALQSTFRYTFLTTSVVCRIRDHDILCRLRQMMSELFSSRCHENSTPLCVCLVAPHHIFPEAFCAGRHCLPCHPAIFRKPSGRRTGSEHPRPHGGGVP